MDIYAFELGAASDVSISMSVGHAIVEWDFHHLTEEGVWELIWASGWQVNGTAWSGVLQPGRYRARIHAESRNIPACDNPYLVQFAGMSCPPTPAPKTSWGRLKATYR
jgi:hypothetical protein